MTIELIAYRGQTVAAATAQRFFLCDWLLTRPAGDCERTFVVFMCVYAGEVLRGELPGPYSDEMARRYARACLIPAELAERSEVDLARAARALGVPLEELCVERAEYASARPPID